MVDSPPQDEYLSEKSWQHWQDLPPEKEEEIIKKFTNFVVKHKIGLIAEMILESMGPLPSIFATISMGVAGPFLEFFEVDTYTAFFRKKGNVKRIIERIEELEEKERSNKEQ